MSCQAVFNYFLSDDSKQDAVTTSEHSKSIIELLKNIKVLFSDMSTIWVNTDGCEEQCRCATALYLLSMLAHAYNIIIDCGIGAPVHGIEVAGFLNATEKRLLSILMKNVKLPGASAYDSQMEIHTSTAITDMSLSR